MVCDETMMFKVGGEENKAEKAMRLVCAAMRDKGYNPVNQLVGYFLSGDPAYVTGHNGARDMVRTIGRDELLEELVSRYIKEIEVGK